MTGHTLAIVLIVVFVPTVTFVVWFMRRWHLENKERAALLEQYGYRSGGQAGQVPDATEQDAADQ